MGRAARRWRPPPIEVQRHFMEEQGQTLESLLSLAVCFVPINQDEDGMVSLGTQASFALLDLFGLYRTVFLRRPDAIPIAVPSGMGLTNARRHLAGSRQSYTVAAFSLKALRATQVLLEARALKLGGKEVALRSCFLAEAVKLLLKLRMQATMGTRFFVDDDALNKLAAPEEGGPLLSSLLPAPTRRSSTLLTVDALFHGRPLVHLALLLWLQRLEASDADTEENATRARRRRWCVWLVTIGMDAAALGLLQRYLAPGIARRGRRRAPDVEVAELGRRATLLIWALARSPIFEAVFERAAISVNRRINAVPVLNAFNFLEVFLAFRPYFSYTSAS